MKVLSLLAFTIAALFFSGCSSKKYFEPEQTFSASHALNSYGGSMRDLLAVMEERLRVVNLLAKPV